MGKYTQSYLYEVGEIVNDNLKIVEQIRVPNGKNRTQKGYTVKSLAFPDDKNDYPSTESNLKKGKGCAYLTGKRICPENSLYSIEHIRSYLIDVEQAKTIAPSHNKPILFKCTCGKVKKMKPYELIKYSAICATCNTNTSYPELFFIAVNEHFKLNFDYQVSYEHGRFDFINHDTKTVVEMNGMAHYEEVTGNWDNAHKNTVESDNKKRKWAKANDYTLIFIDARKSEFEFIQDNINKELLLPNITDEDIPKLLEIIEKNRRYDTKQIIDMYVNQNLSSTKIAEQLNLSQRIISGVLIKSNIDLRGNKLELPEQEIVKLYTIEKMTISDIAEKYGVDDTAINKRLKKNGVEMLRGIRRKYPINEIVKDYNNGMSTTKLAEKYNVSREKVTNLLRDNNVKIRKCNDTKRKSVKCIETGKVYESAHKAMEETGVSNRAIANVCNPNNARKSAGGYHWEYLSDIESNAHHRASLVSQQDKLDTIELDSSDHMLDLFNKNKEKV